jgi:hypothetical protein
MLPCAKTPSPVYGEFLDIRSMLSQLLVYHYPFSTFSMACFQKDLTGLDVLGVECLGGMLGIGCPRGIPLLQDEFVESYPNKLGMPNV